MGDTIRQLVKPRVHEQAVETIARLILRGDFAATGYLPPEPQLCETLQISRSALREAVKVLGGKGLVTPRPRVGTMIRPRDEWNMLDPDLLAWSMDGKPDPEMIKGLMEARRIAEPAAARLAAQRATAADLADMERALLRMSAARDANEFDAYNAADKDFHTAMLAASHNFVLRQLATMIGAALAYSFHITVRELGHALPLHEDVLERIRLRDADGASAAVLRLLDDAIHDLEHSLDQARAV